MIAPVLARDMRALLNGVAEDEMVYVRLRDSIGYTYEGRVLAEECDLGGTRIPTITVEATDGEVVYNQLLRRVVAVEVRPLHRYNGYGVKQFVEDVVNSGTSNFVGEAYTP